MKKYNFNKDEPAIIKEYRTTNNVKAKIIDNNTICIYGDENSSNYFININELVKIICEGTNIINKDLLRKTFKLNEHEIDMINFGTNLYRYFRGVNNE